MKLPDVPGTLIAAPVIATVGMAVAVIVDSPAIALGGILLSIIVMGFTPVENGVPGDY